MAALGMLVGMAAYLYTASLFLGVWSFFLVHGLYILIEAPGTHAKSAAEHATSDQAFERAYRNAEEALRRLSSQNP